MDQRIRVLSSGRLGHRASANVLVAGAWWVGAVLDGEGFPQFFRAGELEEVAVTATTVGTFLELKIAEYQASGDTARVAALVEVRDHMLLTPPPLPPPPPPPPPQGGGAGGPVR